MYSTMIPQEKKESLSLYDKVNNSILHEIMQNRRYHIGINRHYIGMNIRGLIMATPGSLNMGDSCVEKGVIINNRHTNFVDTYVDITLSNWKTEVYLFFKVSTFDNIYRKYLGELSDDLEISYNILKLIKQIQFTEDDSSKEIFMITLVNLIRDIK